MRDKRKKVRGELATTDVQTAGLLVRRVLEVLKTGELLDAKALAKRLDIPEKEADEILKCLIETGIVKRYMGITKFGLDILKLPLPPQ